MAKLILLRHGQSVWNLENRFTGFVDVGLSEKGVEEAKDAGRKLKGMRIDRIFTSVLKRAIDTTALVVEEAKLDDVPIEKDIALNERHYGDLQGLNKDETRAKFGAEQVFKWRRSFDIAPPGGESLKDTCARAIPYYREHILPLVKTGQNILVSAHGNSLRGLIKELEGLSDDAITKVEVPTGVPIVYDIDFQGRVLSKTVLE